MSSSTGRSLINLGIPKFPSTQDPILASEFLRLYNAINIMATTLDTMQCRIPVVFKEAVALGAMVNIYPDTAGTGLFARQAINTSMGMMAHGYCPENDVQIDDVGEIIAMGIHPFITGLTPGTTYYLSGTAGIVTPSKPVGAGRIVQPIGFATSSTQLFVNPNLLPTQL